MHVHVHARKGYGQRAADVPPPPPLDDAHLAGTFWVLWTARQQAIG